MVKRIAKIVGIVLLAFALVVGGYVAYVICSYYRIGDTDLTVEGSATSEIAKTGTAYTIASYNIGFGAYQQDYDCVLDTCQVQDASGNWVKVSGTHLKAFSADDAKRNTQGSIDTLKSLAPDFAFVQEVDVKADRSYGINQAQEIQQALSGMQSSYALNFHTPYLF